MLHLQKKSAKRHGLHTAAQSCQQAEEALHTQHGLVTQMAGHWQCSGQTSTPHSPAACTLCNAALHHTLPAYSTLGMPASSSDA